MSTERNAVLSLLRSKADPRPGVREGALPFRSGFPAENGAAGSVKKHCLGQQENGRSENMTISECYEKLGGDYADVCTRLPGDRLVVKFIGRFLEDDSFDTLCRAMEAGDRGEAFRAAHTLKGVCANLSFTRLQSAASRLTEILRPEGEGIPAEAAEVMAEVRRSYEDTAAAIRAYFNEC